MKQAEVLKYDRLLAAMERTISARLTGEVIVETQAALREVSSDTFDTASLGEALEVANLVGVNDMKTLESIRSARRKIRDGVYGICEQSIANGKKHTIPQKRLDVIPHAENCFACQEKMERENTKSVKLPEGWDTY